MAQWRVAAQSSASTLSGLVVDATGAVLPGAALVLTNAETSAQRQTVSGREGDFVLVALPPGRYTLKATLSGFTPLELSNIVLNVNDRAEVRVELTLAGRGEDVTVKSDAQGISTSPAVGTVVDRQFVENLPLNGRSFQALLALTPGVVLTPALGSQEGGQFSVNGQRTNANYFLVDGVSANVGITSATTPGILPGQSGSGSLPAMTSLGGTNGLVPVDALQEFRVQTSSYAPEFGRMPGGQISIVTRSGTNTYLGSIFEYFRDEALDANDWFANRDGLPKPELMQHDFGGVLGGPIVRNYLFVFGSYEGLRLKQPQSKVTTVPSLAIRQNALPVAQPLLNAFPVPNGRDLGDGAQEYVASYSDPSRLDSSSVRIDYNAGSRMTTFGRVSHAPSYSVTRTGISIQELSQKNTSVTTGSTWIISDRLVNDVRVNYTRNDAPSRLTLGDFGGAVPPASQNVFGTGLSPDNSFFTFLIRGDGWSAGWSWGRAGVYLQRQINVVDSLTLTAASHEWKFGVDYRRMFPQLGGGTETGLEGMSLPVASVRGGAAQYVRSAIDPEERSVAFDNLSLYAQDTWRTSPRLTLTYGLRWELAPPPHAITGDEAITLNNLSDVYGGSMQLAPSGTPLWRTRYNTFAPRVGVSYLLIDKANAQLVARAGGGTFYDLGYGQVASSYRSYPFSATRRVNGVFPFDAATREPPRLGDIRDPQLMVVMDRNLKPPVTYQWNISAEQSLGHNQTLTVSYVGASGRDLLKFDEYAAAVIADSNRFTLNVNSNGGYSEYRALQVQFRRRMRAGIQSLVSYTLGHAQDTASSDALGGIPAERVELEREFGDSDFDVRHVLSAALTCEIPGVRHSSILRPITSNWGLDAMLRTRSGLPYFVIVRIPFPPETRSARPDVVPGQPFWLSDATVPGGRRGNPSAFLVQPPDTQGNMRRGEMRGFAARQVDLALRREFRLPPRIRLQMRVEMFNVLNTPNFANGSGFVGSSATFGVPRQMLNKGLGGLNALYQIGGSRSTQLSAKLLF